MRLPGLHRQSGVIPYRLRDDRIEVLLVTSRGSGRWIVPKGMIEPDLSAAESALKEAYEEAGIRGSVRPEPIGSYRYRKWGGTRKVTLFAMHVDTVLDSWPEQSERKRQWMEIESAEKAIEEDDLRALVRRLREVVSSFE